MSSKLFLRHYLTASAFLLGWSMAALIISILLFGINQKNAATTAFIQSGVTALLSVGTACVGANLRRK